MTELWNKRTVSGLDVYSQDGSRDIDKVPDGVIDILVKRPGPLTDHVKKQVSRLCGKDTVTVDPGTMTPGEFFDLMEKIKTNALVLDPDLNPDSTTDKMILLAGNRLMGFSSSSMFTVSRKLEPFV
jgi:hypothetical protein